MDANIQKGRMYDVCIITTIHRDFDNRVYQRQLNALVDAGLAVVIVAPWDFAGRTRQDFDYVATSYPATRFDRIAHGVRTYRTVTGVSARVYIFHDNDFLPFAWLLKRFSRKRAVYDAHENIPEDIIYGKEWIPAPIRFPISKAFRAFENAVVRELGLSIVAVPSLDRRFRAEGATVALVRNFPNFQAPQTMAQDQAVLYTGELTSDYGIDTIIGLARELKRRGRDIPIRIVDRFHDEASARNRFKRIVADEQLGIAILDSVPAERMPEILRRGCIGISPLKDVPNKALVLPTKIFEYFLFGLVTVASDIPGTRDVVDDGVTGVLVEADHFPAWADAIERLWDDPAEQARIRANGLRAVQDQFNWERERTTLVEFVKKLAAT